jgi:hypothetical protein
VPRKTANGDFALSFISKIASKADDVVEIPYFAVDLILNDNVDIIVSSGENYSFGTLIKESKINHVTDKVQFELSDMMESIKKNYATDVHLKRLWDFIYLPQNDKDVQSAKFNSKITFLPTMVN